jgi:5-methylcytosine-specific restriction endonuclease McrA
MEIISRDEAIQQGLKYYFTGAACKHGHVGKRIVSSHACYECRREMLERKAQEKGGIRWAKTEEERKQRRVVALKKYRDNHPEKIKASQKKFKLENPDRSKEIKRKWASENKEYLRIKAHKRRATMIGVVSKDIGSKLLKLQRNMCACCGVDISKKYELDHIVALINGGRHSDENLQAACPDCNRRKGAKHPVDFMQERGYLL